MTVRSSPSASITATTTSTTEQPSPRVSEPTRIEWSAGAGTTVLGAGEVGPPLGVRVFGGAELVRSSYLSPAVRVALTRTARASRSVDQGAGSFAWTFGTLELCLLRVRAAPSLVARAGVEQLFGVIDAEGRTSYGQNRTRPWWATGLLARGEWRFAGPLTLEADVGLDLAWTRESFIFDPNTPLYEVPRVLWRAGLAAAGHFP
jgi:hypothetical protein